MLNRPKIKGTQPQSQNDESARDVEIKSEVELKERERHVLAERKVVCSTHVCACQQIQM